MALIEIDDRFIKDTAALWPGAVSAGIHLGSEMPVPTRSVFDFIPRKLQSRVSNLRDSTGTLAWDLWSSTTALPHQVVYVRGSDAGQLVMRAIDHKNAFQGEHWSFRDVAVLPINASTAGFYAKVQDHEYWACKIANFPAPVLWDAQREVPRSWNSGDEGALAMVLSELISRQARIPEILRDFAARLTQMEPSALH